MEIEGRIIISLGVQEGVSKAGNNWKKGEWVLETPGMYPKKVKFHVFGEDRINNLGPRLQVNADVVLSVDLESREFNGRWYTDVNCYSVREAGAAGPGDPGVPTAFPHAPQYGAAPAGGFAPAPAAAPAAAPFGAPEGYPAPPAAGGFAPGAAPAPAAPESTDDLPF